VIGNRKAGAYGRSSTKSSPRSVLSQPFAKLALGQVINCPPCKSTGRVRVRGDDGTVAYATCLQCDGRGFVKVYEA
jgi:hypothetical protein